MADKRERGLGDNAERVGKIPSIRSQPGPRVLPAEAHAFGLCSYSSREYVCVVICQILVVGQVAINDPQQPRKVLSYTVPFLHAELFIKVGQVTVNRFETGINRSTTSPNKRKQDASPIGRIGLAGKSAPLFRGSSGMS